MSTAGLPASAVSAGKRRRFRHIFRADGRAVFVAMDHPAYMGMGVAPSAAAAIAQGQPDAVLATWHLARTRPEAFAGAGLVLRVDGGISDLGDPPASDTTSLLYSAEQAMVLGADAVVIMVFPGTPDEEHSLGRLARLAAECELLGLPVMAESIPGGWPRTVPWTAENVGRGARLAVELGADIVKTMCPGPPRSSRRWPRPARLRSWPWAVPRSTTRTRSSRWPAAWSKRVARAWPSAATSGAPTTRPR